MQEQKYSNSTIINGIALGFSLAFLLSALVATFYTGEGSSLFYNWYLILISPCPLVTDYFAIGGLASAMFNAGVCGLSMWLFMVGLKGHSHANTMAGFFLVVAHCFYGLNFLNMWPCFLSVMFYLHKRKLDIKNNLHVCMFATSFGPFISEFLFRYTQGDSRVFGEMNLTVSGILITIVFSLILGYVIPAILPGALAMHKGYNLYNGGLAFGLFGFFVFNFMYKTMGIAWTPAKAFDNHIYLEFNHSFQMYANIFFLLIFATCLLVGYWLNGKSFHGYYHMISDTGYRSDYASKYGMPLCLINIGFYGSLFLAYLNFVVTLTDKGAGFTGPTFGVMLAALTFSAMGQHPKNVWPILVGYLLLYGTAYFFCAVNGREMSWSISTQAYINGVAFATGLCPIVGRYGIRAGILAGFVCASMCSSTSALHGGFVLYNGGFTTGITALILVPILEHYASAREQMKPLTLNFRDLITVEENK